MGTFVPQRCANATHGPCDGSRRVCRGSTCPHGRGARLRVQRAAARVYPHARGADNEIPSPAMPEPRRTGRTTGRASGNPTIHHAAVGVPIRPLRRDGAFRGPFRPQDDVTGLRAGMRVGPCGGAQGQVLHVRAPAWRKRTRSPGRRPIKRCPRGLNRAAARSPQTNRDTLLKPGATRRPGCSAGEARRRRKGGTRQRKSAPRESAPATLEPRAWNRPSGRRGRKRPTPTETLVYRRSGWLVQPARCPRGHVYLTVARGSSKINPRNRPRTPVSAVFSAHRRPPRTAADPQARTRSWGVPRRSADGVRLVPP